MAEGGAGGGPMGKLQGLFEWSMKYQRGDNNSDNNKNNEAADPAAREAAIRRAAAEFTPERRAFLEKALAEFTRDHAQRMREIKEALDGGENEQEAATTAEATAETAESVNEKAELLDELHDIVENLDYARDMVKIGGLPTLLRLLRSPHASLRWRAADVLAASAANNPPVQRWLLESGALPPLMALLELSAEAAAFPTDSTADLLRARTKAVHALSALVRHFDGGFSAFRDFGGVAQLARLEGAAAAGGAGGTENASDDSDQSTTSQLRRRLLRKELELLRYALQRNPGDCEAVAKLGTAERAVSGTGLDEAAAAASSSSSSSADPELRAAALAVLLELAQHPQAWVLLRERCPDLGKRLVEVAEKAAAATGESAPDAPLARDLAARLADGAKAPQQAKPALNDHIDLDPHDNSGATHKSIPLKKSDLPTSKPPQERTLSLGAPPPPPPS